MQAQDYNGHVGTELPPADDKGRPNVKAMSDRELTEETVITLRQFADGLAILNEHAQSNPMMKGLLGL